MKHISTPVSALRTKQSKGWQNAFKEMEEHKKMVQDGVGPIRDEEVEEEVEKKQEKRGVKRKSEQREAEKFVKKSHSDAGQVNSISTSQEYSRSENHSSKKVSGYPAWYVSCSHAIAGYKYQGHHGTCNIPDCIVVNSILY